MFDEVRKYLKTIARQHATTIRKLDNIQRQLDELEPCEVEEAVAECPRPWWKRIGWRHAA